MSSSPPFAKKYAPARIMMLALTDECNLRCSYCFVQKKPRHMSEETMCKAIDFFLNRNISGLEHQLHLTFFGGEPFTRLDRMEQAIAWSRKRRPNLHKKIRFSATTNGTVASPRVEKIIRGSGMALLVSMDGGHDANAARRFVSGRPSYEHVARNLPRLVEWSSNVLVRMTLHPDALDLVGNIQQVLSLGAPGLVISAVSEAPWSRHADALESAYLLQPAVDLYLQRPERSDVGHRSARQHDVGDVQHERYHGDLDGRQRQHHTILL